MGHISSLSIYNVDNDGEHGDVMAGDEEGVVVFGR